MFSHLYHYLPLSFTIGMTLFLSQLFVPPSVWAQESSSGTSSETCQSPTVTQVITRADNGFVALSQKLCTDKKGESWTESTEIRSLNAQGGVESTIDVPQLLAQKRDNYEKSFTDQVKGKFIQPLVVFSTDLKNREVKIFKSFKDDLFFITAYRGTMLFMANSKGIIKDIPLFTPVTDDSHFSFFPYGIHCQGHHYFQILDIKTLLSPKKENNNEQSFWFVASAQMSGNVCTMRGREKTDFSVPNAQVPIIFSAELPLSELDSSLSLAPSPDPSRKFNLTILPMDSMDSFEISKSFLSHFFEEYTMDADFVPLSDSPPQLKLSLLTGYIKNLILPYNSDNKNTLQWTPRAHRDLQDLWSLLQFPSLWPLEIEFSNESTKDKENHIHLSYSQSTNVTKLIQFFSWREKKPPLNSYSFEYQSIFALLFRSYIWFDSLIKISSFDNKEPKRGMVVDHFDSTKIKSKHQTDPKEETTVEVFVPNYTSPYHSKEEVEVLNLFGRITVEASSKEIQTRLIDTPYSIFLLVQKQNAREDLDTKLPLKLSLKVPDRYDDGINPWEENPNISSDDLLPIRFAQESAPFNLIRIVKTEDKGFIYDSQFSQNLEQQLGTSMTQITAVNVNSQGTVLIYGINSHGQEILKTMNLSQ